MSGSVSRWRRFYGSDGLGQAHRRAREFGAGGGVLDWDGGRSEKAMPVEQDDAQRFARGGRGVGVGALAVRVRAARLAWRSGFWRGVVVAFRLRRVVMMVRASVRVVGLVRGALLGFAPARVVVLMAARFFAMLVRRDGHARRGLVALARDVHRHPQPVPDGRAREHEQVRREHGRAQRTRCKGARGSAAGGFLDARGHVRASAWGGAARGRPGGDSWGTRWSFPTSLPAKRRAAE